MYGDIALDDLSITSGPCDNRDTKTPSTGKWSANLFYSPVVYTRILTWVEINCKFSEGFSIKNWKAIENFDQWKNAN